MEDDAKITLEDYKRMRRKKDSAKRSMLTRVLYGIGLVLALVALFLLVNIGLNYREEMREREKTLTSDEWVAYESLKHIAEEPSEIKSRIRTYERMLSLYRDGKLPSYTPQDSLGWEKSSLELKIQFNAVIQSKAPGETHKTAMEYYNDRIRKYSKFTNRDELPLNFSLLPSNLLPYELPLVLEQEPNKEGPH